MKSKALLLVDESSFFLPTFVNELIDILQDSVLFKAIVVMEAPKKGNIKRNLLENIGNLTFIEVLKLGMRLLLSKFALYRTPDGKYVSLRSVHATLRQRKIEVTKVYTYSQLEHVLGNLKEGEYDFLVSSNSMIVKGEWLRKFIHGAINRHSSPLPSYGGLWPVFHSAINGEKIYGASVHIMTSKIDEGPVLAQRVFKANPKESIFTRYSNTYSVSPSLVQIAIRKLLDGNVQSISNFDSSYFGKLNSEHFAKLRSRGMKFI